MKQIKFDKKILFIQDKINNNIHTLKKLKILQSDLNNYFKKDKEEFLLYWFDVIKIFDELKIILKKSKYRTLFIKFNYTNLIISRYVSYLYYNFLVQLISNFGIHEIYLRKILQEKYKKDYINFAKFIYKPKFINLINTPNIFLIGFKKDIDENYYNFINIDEISIDIKKRVLIDYGNLFFYISKFFEKIIFNISKFIGLSLSKIKFTFRKKGLISKKNLKKYLEISKPGDIFLTRSNWNATNIPIPGFWKHMSLYLGTGDYLLKKFKKNIKINIKKNKHYIIESTSDGILVKDINKLILHNDYLGVFRTNFTNKKINKSIKNALLQQGKGYDFGVNYYSDKNMVCSELVLKSFQKEKNNDEGIEVILESIGPSLSFPPNNFLKILDKNNIEPIFFIDSIEKNGKNFVNTNNELIKTKNRARFTFLNK